jgi:predicted dehydrogenase
MINAAIVGLGRWGRRLVDSIQKEGTPIGAKLRFSRAIVRNLSNAQDYASGQKLSLTNTLDNVLRDPSIDALVFATPHDEHPAQIIAATKAKKHVFVEKPLAFKRVDAEAAVRSVRDNNSVLAVGYNRRFLPAAAKLREDIVNGSFGNLLRVEGNFSNNSGLNYRAGMWRATEKGPKAALSAMGVHILDFFIHLCGPIASVRTTSTRRSMPVDADDVVCVNLSFKNGMVGTLSTMLTTPRQWRVQLFGTSQWAHMRDEHLLDICDSSGALRALIFDPVDTLKLELEAFADAIAGRIDYPVSLSDALHGVAATEAILESAANGGTLVVVPAAHTDLAGSN